MQDFLGTSVEVGDYLFGGSTCSLVIIKDKDKSDDFAMVSNIGQQSSRRAVHVNYVKISPEQLMIYFMQKGYKT